MSILQELSPKAKVSYDDTKFEVEFDVREFRPEELSIKTDGDVLVFTFAAPAFTRTSPSSIFTILKPSLDSRRTTPAVRRRFEPFPPTSP